ncbi:MAG: DUF2442 domain-containing protein [Gammaproteobacteria bacterium]|nr:DUF2442 domain-containing protein [Gammaproteobacteria bacterium]
MKDSAIPVVRKVYPRQNYCLEVHFSNGESGILDMRPYLDFGVFKLLKDMHVFQQVRVSFDTLEWQSGIDLDPEFVYQKTNKNTYYFGKKLPDTN